MINKICDVQSGEVFGEWLKHEYSGRGDFRMHVDQAFPGSHDLIAILDYSDPHSNQRRLEILKSWRGPVVNEIPADTAWTLSTIDRSALEGLSLIHSSPWRQLSSGSLRALDVARTIESEPAVCMNLYGGPIQYILDNLESLAKQQSKITAIGSGQSQVVVIDGVHRTVAMALFYLIREIEELLPREMYLGWSGSGYRASFL